MSIHLSLELKIKLIKEFQSGSLRPALLYFISDDSLNFVHSTEILWRNNKPNTIYTSIKMNSYSRYPQILFRFILKFLLPHSLLAISEGQRTKSCNTNTSKAILKIVLCAGAQRQVSCSRNSSRRCCITEKIIWRSFRYLKIDTELLALCPSMGKKRQGELAVKIKQVHCERKVLHALPLFQPTFATSSLWRRSFGWTWCVLTYGGRSGKYEKKMFIHIR